MTAVSEIPTADGELLPTQSEIWQAIAAAAQAVDPDLDEEATRRAFGIAFIRALHAAGFVLVTRARSNTRITIDADLYALALSGKHDAERVLESIGRLVRAHRTFPTSLLEDFATGVLSLAGREPPGQLYRVRQTAERLRAIAGILDGQAIDEIPPLPDPLVQFLNGRLPQDEADVGGGELK